MHCQASELKLNLGAFSVYPQEDLAKAPFDFSKNPFEAQCATVIHQQLLMLMQTLPQTGQAYANTHSSVMRAPARLKDSTSCGFKVEASHFQTTTIFPVGLENLTQQKKERHREVFPLQTSSQGLGISQSIKFPVFEWLNIRIGMQVQLLKR